LTEQKGFDVLIRAAALLRKNVDWALLVLGEGQDRKALEDLAEALSLASRVHLPGWATEAGPTLRDSDIFVLSSRWEGSPLVLLEAMATGLAVVAADCPTGPREIIRSDIDGLLVPPEDPAALARAIDRLVGDKALRSKLGARATDVRERFSLDRIAELWANLLEVD
jgi:glycosyltransferase involved in cell wall biosynthesis